jgi:sortase A
MNKTRKVLAVFSALLVLSGLGTASFAGFQIYQMNSNLAGDYLPKLDSLDPSANLNLLTKPKVGDVIGSLSIPRLKRVIPIIEGTGSKELKKGVGHYVGSVLPGARDNSVLAGHRDSVFRNLGEVKLNDLITVTTDYGKFVYKVRKIRIVGANDRTVIVPTPEAVLTLSTCYPFRFIGNAPKRYIVQAGLVRDDPIA